MRNGKKPKPRPVDFFGRDNDFECAVLGSMGFSNRMIISKTRLTPGQIGYRLKKAQVKRMDYRDGTSDMAQLVIKSLRTTIDKEVIHHLKETLL